MNCVFILVLVHQHFLFWCLFLFLQEHLISSQLFVFLYSFCFCGDYHKHVCKEGVNGFKKSWNFLLIAIVKFERLMCEVEFWEVFLPKVLGV